MTKYLLDTNICIFFLQGKYNVPARIKLVSENLKHLSRIPNIKTENWIMRK